MLFGVGGGMWKRVSVKFAAGVVLPIRTLAIGTVERQVIRKLKQGRHGHSMYQEFSRVKMLHPR